MSNKLTPIHVLLFVLTFMTTLFAGAMLNGVVPWEQPEKIYLGLPFSLTLLFILLTHEMAHYLMSRRHNVSATLPYFIPAPSIIGTFGAVIKMKPPIPDRRSLIDIGASGPIGGFIIAVIASLVGLYLSEVRPAGELRGGIAFGSSILFTILSKILSASLLKITAIVPATASTFFPSHLVSGIVIALRAKLWIKINFSLPGVPLGRPHLFFLANRLFPRL